MIQNDQQLEATFQALGCLCRAVASLRERLLPANPSQYDLFAEGPLDEISKIQAEINAYLGLTGRPAVADELLREAPPPYDTPAKGSSDG